MLIVDACQHLGHVSFGGLGGDRCIIFLPDHRCRDLGVVLLRFRFDHGDRICRED